MHNAAFLELGLDAVYLAFDVAPEDLMRVLPAMRDMGFGGVNLTVPLKETAFNGLDLLDESANRARAVNTIEFLENGEIKGHTTDAKGFLLSIAEDLGMETVSGKKVFLLGTGGAGRTLAMQCADEGAAEVILADIDLDRAGQVKKEITESTSSAASCIEQSDWDKAAAEADLVIQATPVGMKEEDKSLLGPSAFRSGQAVYDLVYMYPETDLLRTAREGGARISNGLGMLMHQGAWAFTIWTGKPAATEAMRAALEKAVYAK